MMYVIDEPLINGMTLLPLKHLTVRSYFKQSALSLKKNALAMQVESSSADFCLTCLCIYDQDGGCMCTKYARNSAGDYIAKQEVK